MPRNSARLETSSSILLAVSALCQMELTFLVTYARTLTSQSPLVGRISSARLCSSKVDHWYRGEQRLPYPW